MWNYYEFPGNSWHRWHLNGAEFYLKRNGEEWRTLIRAIRLRDMDGSSSGPDTCGEPEILDQDEVSIAVAPGDRAGIKPVMPDRPFLLSATNTVTILDGAKARFIVRLPLFLRLETENGGILREFTPFILSNTWFGDKTSGRLCYSIRTSLDPLCEGETGPEYSPESGIVPFDPANPSNSGRSDVACEITVLNHSRDTLRFSQLAVYTELLRIHEENGILKTDSIVVDGLPDGSLKVTVHTDPLPSSVRLLSPARMRQSELLVRRGIDFLKTITGM